MKKESESLRLELDRANFEVARLKEESRLNADSSLQRKALHAQLSNYPSLLEENERLKRENDHLTQTAENTQVLLEQVHICCISCLVTLFTAENIIYLSFCHANSFSAFLK